MCQGKLGQAATCFCIMSELLLKRVTKSQLTFLRRDKDKLSKDLVYGGVRACCPGKTSPYTGHITHAHIGRSAPYS